MEHDNGGPVAASPQDRAADRPPFGSPRRQKTLPPTDEDAFLSSYRHVQRPEWSEHYVNFEALMGRVRRMEARLVEIRRQRRQERHHPASNTSYHANKRNRRRSIGNELEAMGDGLKKSPSVPGPAATTSKPSNSPRHKCNRSEGFLPALAAAPLPAPDTPASTEPTTTGNVPRLSSPTSAGNLELTTTAGDNNGSTFSRLSPRHKNMSLDWLVSLPNAIVSDGATSTGRMRSDSTASIASSTDRKDRDWIQPGSEQFEFCSLIDLELERALLFYLAEVGRVADELSDLSRLMSATTSSLEQYTDALNRYRHLGALLADLYLFVGSNLSAIRKVLTRHDRIVRSDGKALCRYYVRTRREGGTSHLQSLWAHNGLGAAYGSWRKGYQAVLRYEILQLEQGGLEGDVSSGAEEAALTRFHGDPCVNCIEATAGRIQDATHRSLQELVVLGSVGNTLAFEQSILADPVDDKDWDMAFYALTRDRLCGLIDLGSLSMHLEEGGFGGQGALFGADLDEGKAAAQGIEYYLPLGLNLFSTFLYMANYFIAGPTSAVYIETLGGNKALAGLVVGCTPWAAMASTVLFSLWTSYNFKRPLLFSGACLCIGNLLYGLALHFKSIELVLIGRIGVGLGGPRYVGGEVSRYLRSHLCYCLNVINSSLSSSSSSCCRVINRRYIADVAPMESRTAVSAAFVTLSAAGTAVGPGLSALFQQIDFTIDCELNSSPCLWLLPLLLFVFCDNLCVYTITQNIPYYNNLICSPSYSSSINRSLCIQWTHCTWIFYVCSVVVLLFDCCANIQGSREAWSEPT